MVDESLLAAESVAKKIAGEIVLSEDAGKTIQKWRAIFKIPQRALAEQMGVMPSVVSDYENSRRKSPGIKVVKRIVDAMIALDEKNGARVIKEFAAPNGKSGLSEAILDLKEYSKPVKIKDFCKKIGALPSACQPLFEDNLFGYTVVDSHKAISELPLNEMVKLYGLTNKRALVFTKTSSGRSSMVALKMAGLRPALVVLHGAGTTDELARRIAESEGIPLAICRSSDVEGLIEVLKKGI